MPNIISEEQDEQVTLEKFSSCALEGLNIPG